MTKNGQSSSPNIGQGKHDNWLVLLYTVQVYSVHCTLYTIYVHYVYNVYTQYYNLIYYVFVSRCIL